MPPASQERGISPNLATLGASLYAQGGGECTHSHSKWAKVSYKVDGKTYQSQNRIQVPMALQIGSTVKIRYDKFNPEKLYSFSLLRIVISILIAAVCILAAVFKLI